MLRISLSCLMEQQDLVVFQVVFFGLLKRKGQKIRWQCLLYLFGPIYANLIKFPVSKLLPFT